MSTVDIRRVKQTLFATVYRNDFGTKLCEFYGCQESQMSFFNSFNRFFSQCSHFLLPETCGFLVFSGGIK